MGMLMESLKGNLMDPFFGNLISGLKRNCEIRNNDVRKTSTDFWPFILILACCALLVYLVAVMH